MYFKAHEPPHIHAKYGDNEAIFYIEDVNTEGYFPSKGKRMVYEFISQNKEELLDMRDLKQIKTLPPIE